MPSDAGSLLRHDLPTVPFVQVFIGGIAVCLVFRPVLLLARPRAVACTHAVCAGEHSLFVLQVMLLSIARADVPGVRALRSVSARVSASFPPCGRPGPTSPGYFPLFRKITRGRRLGGWLSRAMPESVVNSAHTTPANLWQPERQRQCAHIKGVGGGMRNTYA